MPKITKKQKKEIGKFFTKKLKELYYFCKENDIEYLSLCNFAATSTITWATYRFLGQPENNFGEVHLCIEDEEKKDE